MKSAGTILLALFALLFVRETHADGGTVIAQETAGDLTVTIFASPAPLRAGPADISVMLQHTATGQPVLDREVIVSASSLDESSGVAWVPPCCSMEKSSIAVPATHAAAQNKLLYAADVIVPAAGPTALTVRVDDAAPLIVRLDAQPPRPPVSLHWPYLALPPIIIGLFALNRHARRRD